MAKTILVIEDNVKHTRDAERFFRTIPNVNVIYASNYTEASEVMYGLKLGFDHATTRGSKGNIDGVISDIYFPLTSEAQWDQPEAIGVRVAIELSKLGIPFVLNTAGYHHGRKYEWITQLARSQGWEIVDTADSNLEKDADSKNWEGAHKSLEEKMK